MEFPLSIEDRISTSAAFHEKYDGVPLCLGCVDGTHIPILAPKGNEKAYINRENYHSVNLMVSDYLFL